MKSKNLRCLVLPKFFFSTLNFTKLLVLIHVLVFADNVNAQEIQLGSGTASTGVTTASPVNISERNARMQMIYTASEINAAGVSGYKILEKFGFYIESLPEFALNNYSIRMKLVENANVSQHNEGDFTTVYSTTSYQPLATGFQQVTLTNPFWWDGTYNILVEVCFGSLTSTGSSGTVRVYNATSGFRFSRSNTTPLCDQPTETVANTKPQCLMTFGTQPATDAGLSAIVSPEKPFSAGNSSVSVRLENYGTANLTSATIAWTVNGVAQTPFNWSGTVSPGGSTVVNIGSYSFVAGTYYTIVANASAAGDVIPNNNQVTRTDILPALTGNYTIAAIGGDFTSFSEAVSSLTSGGISAAVNFNISAGTYYEQLQIPAISGASETNTITFKSQSGDKQDVKISFDAPSNANFLVRMNGASFVRFENMTFEALNNFYGIVFDFTGGASNNILSGSTFTNVEYVYNSTTRSLIHSSGGVDSNNEFSGNDFINGTYGLYYLGPSVSNRETGTKIFNNTFTNQYSRAISLHNQDDAIVRGNQINSASALTNQYGIYFTSVFGQSEISSNKISMPSGRYGIYLGSSGNNTTQGVIANNFVYIGGTTDVYGIYFTGTTNYGVFFNSVNVTSSNSSSSGLYLTAGSNNVLKNNIFSNSGSGYAYFINSVGGISETNFNNLYALQSPLAYWTANRANLTELKDASSQEANSLSLNPGFKSADDLHVFDVALKGKGTPITGITTDIDGDARNATTPDIGADEFVPSALDIGVISLNDPSVPFLHGNNTLNVTFRNYGSDNISAARINWEVNGVVQTAFNWTGNLSSGNDIDVNIGSYVFQVGEPYNLKIWSSLPNNSSDGQSLNDTISIANLYAGLQGSYTIASEGADFNSFSNAVTTLNNGGILGSVTFNVADGTYAEQIRIDNFPGNDCETAVIFQSASSDSSKVVLESNSGSTANYTVMLNGASGITFKNLTLKSLNATYGTVLDLRNGAKCNSFTNNALIALTSNSTSTARSVINSPSGTNNNHNDNDNKITNNLIEGGAYGVYILGYSTGNTNRETGNVIEGNIFRNQHYMGLSLYYQEGIHIKSNIIETNSSRNDFYGIYLYYCYNENRIEANKISAQNGGYGINFYSFNALGQESIIANNFIRLGGTNTAYGIAGYSSTYNKVVFNTISITSSNLSNGIALYISGGNNYTLLNNILSNTGGGRAVYISNINTVAQSNHNNYHVTGEVFGFLNGVINNFEAWKTASGQDINSLNIDPSFVSATDLHIREVALYSAGTPVTEVAADIDGDLRNATNPSIGADEIVPSANDAGIVAIKSPVMPFAAGNQPVIIELRNYGENNLTSVSVEWKINDVQQTTFNWTGSLGKGQAADVTIGNYNFAFGGVHDIEISLKSPNGSIDGDPSNDSFTALQQFTGLAGAYSIGGLNPDFETIAMAVEQLEKGGAAEAVTFNLRSGTYNEQVLIRNRPGVPCEIPVIFQSETLDAESVIIQNASVAGSNYTIRFDNASGITFRYLTMQATNNTYGIVIDLRNGASCNKFESNIIVGVNVNTTADSRALVYSPSGNHYSLLDNNNVFEDNLFLNGSFGIFMQGVGTNAIDMEKGLVIKGNTFENQYYTAIFLYYQENVQIEENLITTNKSYSSYYGIYTYYTREKLFIQKNDIQLQNGGGYGLHVYVSTSTAENRTQIANNFISINGTSNAYGIYLQSATHCYSYFNNVLLGASVGSSSRALFSSSGSNQFYYNNIFANRGPGLAFYINSTNAVQGSDHNNFFAPNGVLAFWSGNRTTLEALQTSSGYDANSYAIDPLFVSEHDLHVNSAILNGSGLAIDGISDDIDGEERGTPPDIGADEFTPSGTNAGLIAVQYPVAPFEPGQHPVSISFENKGATNLTSLTLNWEVNGQSQTAVNWTGELTTGNSISAALGNFNFLDAVRHDLKVWLSEPNGSLDIDNSDDTLRVNNVFTGLSGSYTVGGTNPKFASLTEAVLALNNGGVRSSVVFSIADGTYEEQLNIQAFPGNACDTGVIFKSVSEDSSKVVISHNSGSANNFVLQLNGARGVVFRDLTLQSLNTNYGTVISMLNGASCNLITNNYLLGPSPNSTSTARAIIHSPSGSNAAHNSNDNIFRNNLIENGSYGIYYLAYSTSAGTRETGTVIENNIFKNQHYMGIQLYYQESFQLEGNTIVTNSSRNDFYGLYVYYSYSGNKILRNIIRATNGGYGMFMYVMSGAAGDEAIIANNFVSLGGTGTAQGISLSYGAYNQVYHNTIKVTSTDANNGRSIYTVGGNNVNIVNNIFANIGGGYSIYVNSTNAIDQMDFNNYFTTGPNLGYWSAGRSNLNAWQSASGKDGNSLSVNPSFIDDEEGFRIGNVDLSRAGTPLATVTDDIDGQVRNPESPTIGADEISTTTADAGLLAFTSPSIPFLAGNSPITVTLLNNAGSALSSVKIDWQINGNLQTPYNWTGTVAPGNTLDVSVGNFNFQAGTVYNLKAWTSAPNGEEDQLKTNDTIRMENLAAGLAGNYTVGGQDADFETLAEAITVIENGGLVGGLTLNIRDGEYFEQIRINKIPGASALNKLIIQSEAQDSSAVKIRFNANSLNNYTLQLNGAEHLEIRDISLISENNSYGVVLDLRNGTDYILFDGVAFYGRPINSTAVSLSVIHSVGAMENDNLAIHNSSILNGSYGMYMQGIGGNRLTSGFTATDNLFVNNYYRGVRLYAYTNPLLSNNSFTSQSNTTAYNGVELNLVNNGFVFYANRINAANGTGLYVVSSNASAANRALVANNFIQAGSANNTAYGIYYNASSYINTYFNSVNITSGHATNGRAFFISGTSNVNSQNNIYSTGGGYAVYMGAVSNIAVSDYNNYFSSGPNIAYLNGNIPGISEWKVTIGKDANSLAVNPLFVSQTDLHVLQSQLKGAGLAVGGISEDIDGDIRNVTNPDIGADEFQTLATDIGVIAFEPNSGCVLPDNVPVVATIQNFGSSAYSGFNVAYKINDLEAIVENVGDLAVQPGGSIQYTFATRADLSAPGVYQMSVYTLLENDENQENDALSKAVQNYLSPDVSVSDNITICEGASIDLFAKGGTKYLWSTGSTSSLIKVSPVETTKYLVDITTPQGCVQKDSILVTVQETPDKPLIVSSEPDNSFCVGNSLTLSVLSDHSIQWFRRTQTSEFLIDSVASITVTVPATYLVRTRSANGCVANSDLLVVSQLPDPAILATPATSICNGDAVTLQVQHASTYNWSIGSTSQQIVVSPTVDTWYKVSGENAKGCAYADSVHIHVLPNEAPGAPGNYIPVSNTLNLEMPFTINWQPGSNATNYDIYIWKDGEEKPQQPYLANIDKITASINNLEYFQNYNWQVVARNSCFTTEGLVNTFTTSGRPDLTVENIISVDEFIGGDEITVTWTVKNIGNGTTGSRKWKDYIWLSTDLDLRQADDILLGQFDNQSFLEAGASYLQTRSVKVPDNIAGIYYLFVTTNVNDAYCWNLTETGCATNFGHHNRSFDEENTQNNFDHKRVSIFLPPLPDLKVTSVGAPTDLFSGDEFPLTYEVKNIGDREASGQLLKGISGVLQNCASGTSGGCICYGYMRFWRDAIYISKEESFDFSTATKLFETDVMPGTMVNCAAINNFVQPDSTYRKNLTAKIPNSAFGTYYIYVVSNFVGLREVFFSNNIMRSEPINVSLTPPANLVLTNINLPSQLTVNENFTINWTVSNQGINPPVVNSWQDRVYVSDVPDFDLQTARLLGTYTHVNGSSLTNGVSYNASLNLKLPRTEVGTKYFFVYTDAQSAVFEFTFEEDNIRRAGPIDCVVGDLADLAVTNIVLPDTIVKARPFEIFWTVTNVGNKPTDVNWQDGIFISDQPTWNPTNATTIGNRAVSSALNPGQSITLSSSLTIAANSNAQTGWYFYVFTNRTNTVFENELQNNVRSDQDFRTRPVAIYNPEVVPIQNSDLNIANLAVSPDPASGKPVTITFEVTNIGEARTSATYWQDGIYLSNDNRLSQDDYFLGELRGNSLNPTEKYTSNGEITLPNGISGTYYLFVLTDRTKANRNEILHSNNQTSIPVLIELSPSPDLNLVDVGLPSEIYLGQRFDVAYQVENIGEADIDGSRWFDAVYINNAPVLAGARQLGSISKNQPLAINTQYESQVSVQVPIGYNGNYYLIVLTNSRATDIYEDGRRDNNVKYIPIFVIVPDPADLAVTSIELPETVELGNAVNVDYTIENVGTNVAVGSLRNIAYFSGNNELDASTDPVFGITDDNISLQPGESRTFRTNNFVKAINPGLYYSIVQTNALNSIPETDLGNNVLASDNQITVDVRQLPLSTVESTLIYKDRPVYYRVEVTEGKDLLVTLTGSTTNGSNQIYASYNKVATSNEFEFREMKEEV
jgi:parallel beta-helix repeat protein